MAERVLEDGKEMTWRPYDASGLHSRAGWLGHFAEDGAGRLLLFQTNRPSPGRVVTKDWVVATSQRFGLAHTIVLVLACAFAAGGLALLPLKQFLWFGGGLVCVSATALLVVRHRLMRGCLTRAPLSELSLPRLTVDGSWRIWGVLNAGAGGALSAWVLDLAGVSPHPAFVPGIAFAVFFVDGCLQAARFERGPNGLRLWAALYLLAGVAGAGLGWAFSQALR